VKKQGLCTLGGCAMVLEQLWKELLKQAYDLTLITYPRSTKMYHNLKTYFCWMGMKKDISRPCRSMSYLSKG